MKDVAYVKEKNRDRIPAVRFVAGFSGPAAHRSRWRISDKVSEHLHFHNCLEIGICHADSGTMIFEGVSMPFGAGDVTCVPRHVTHTTYSSPGMGSLWSYLFIDPCELFQDMFQDSASELDIPVFLPA